MKKSFKALAVVAAAVATLASCSKQEVNAPVAAERTITLNFNAQPLETKTAFGEKEGTAYPTLWTETSTLQASLNFANPKSATLTPSADNKSATFTVTFDVPETAPESYVVYAVSPAILGTSSPNVNIDIPTGQTPTATSVDESAQFVFGTTTLTALPDPVDPEAEKKVSKVEAIDMSFSHLTAYGKLTIKDEAVIAAGVQSVSLTASSPIAGRWHYDTEEGVLTEYSTASTITLTTTSAEDIWFAIAPADLSAGTLKVTVETGAGNYEKTIDFTGTGKGNFKAGTVASFGVKNFTKVENDVVYNLVTDVKDLTPNSVVLIAAAESDYVIGKTQNSNNRAAAVAKKNADGSAILNPIDVETFVVEAGVSAGSVAFHAQENEGYIYAAGGTSSNYLRTKDELDATSSWTVSIDDETGEATIKCANTAVTHNWLRYNASGLFSCYTTGQQPVAIYKLEGSGDEPVELIDIEPEQAIVYIDAEGGTSDEIFIEFDGESCDLNASVDVDWITLDSEIIADGDGVVFTVAPNTTTSERTGVITLSAPTVNPATITVIQEAGEDNYETLPYEALKSSIDGFTISNVALGSKESIWSWNSSYSYANASGYKAGEATESWLISPVISLAGASLVTMNFSHATNYFKGTAPTATAVLVKKAEDTEWTALEVNYPGSDSWAFVSSGEINLSAYAGSKIQVAFKYTSDGSTEGTWEVKNLEIKEVDALTPKFSGLPTGKVELEVGDTYEATVAVNSNGTLSYTSSDEKVATVSASGVVTAIAEGSVTITVNAAANGNYAAGSTSFAVTVTDPNSQVKTASETIDFSAQGFSNAADVTTVSGDVVSVTFDKGTGTNSSKYYTSGFAVRAYAGNTVTVSAGNKTIKGIVVNYASGYNNATTSSGTYADGEWSGSETEVVFNVSGGQFRIVSMTVTYVAD